MKFIRNRRCTEMGAMSPCQCTHNQEMFPLEFREFARVPSRAFENIDRAACKVVELAYISLEFEEERIGIPFPVVRARLDEKSIFLLPPEKQNGSGENYETHPILVLTY